MLRIEEVAAFLERKLNELGEKCKPVYKFKLFAEVGEMQYRGEYNGIVSTVETNLGNLPNFTDIDYTYLCQIAVPNSGANFNVINIQSIIEGLVKRDNGLEFEIGEGKGIFTFSNIGVGQQKIEYGIGESIPVKFTIKIKYTASAITSSQKHWFLDDLEIPYLSEGVFIDKEGRTQKVNGENFSKTMLTGQTKFYKFVFPFDNNELCAMLQKDILSGDLEKSYELKYYDGVSYTKETPFLTQVSIFKNGDTSAQLTKTSQFNITFTDVDNGNSDVKYYLGLCDTVFDNNSNNTRFFEATEGKTAKEVQTDYWNEKVQAGCIYEEIKAPNLDSIDITNQIYRNRQKYELFDITNKNYAVVKVEKNGEPIKYYFYFVTNASIGANNQVLFDLKLDSIQTYFFEDDIEFGDCFIEKACLNRWVDNGDGTVSFDGTLNSKLFEKEEFQDMAKRQTSKTRIHVYPKSDNVSNKLLDWLKENIVCWVWAFLDSSKKDGFKTLKKVGEKWAQSNLKINPMAILVSVDGIEDINLNANLDSNMVCFAYPIYKNFKRIKLKCDAVSKSENFSYDYDTMKLFLDANGGDSFVYGKKISNLSPFSTGNYLAIENYEFDIYDNLILKIDYDEEITEFSNSSMGRFVAVGDFEELNFKGFIYQPKLTSSFSGVAQKYKVMKRFTFDKNEIIGALKNPEFNPKLLSKTFYELKLVDESGESYSYDLQKLNTDELEFKYCEPIVPDISRTYFTIKNTENGVYSNKSAESWIGLSASSDKAISLVNDQYKQMLANNKNFFMQNVFKGAETAVQGAMGAGINLASGNIGGAVASGVGAIVSPITNLISNHFTIDNLKNAPSSIQNARSGVFLQGAVNQFGIYIEEWEILNFEKEIVNDFMVRNGYTINCFGYLKEFLNIRKYFNFVKAEIDMIVGLPLSNNVKFDIKEKFLNGIRFWNSDDIQYNLENYEKWLEN